MDWHLFYYYKYMYVEKRRGWVDWGHLVIVQVQSVMRELVILNHYTIYGPGNPPKEKVHDTSYALNKQAVHLFISYTTLLLLLLLLLRTAATSSTTERDLAVRRSSLLVRHDMHVLGVAAPAGVTLVVVNSGAGGADFTLNLGHVLGDDLGVVAVDDLGQLLEGGALCLDVLEVDEGELEADPALQRDMGG